MSLRAAGRTPVALAHSPMSGIDIITGVLFVEQATSIRGTSRFMRANVLGVHSRPQGGAMASYYVSEDLARFSEMAKTNPQLFDLFMKWYAATMEPGALD